MPHAIPSRLRKQIVKLYLKGSTYEECAEKTGVSFSSCRNIIDELKKRRYGEYESFLDELEELRSLNQQLRTNNRSLPQAAQGLNIFNSLVEMGIDPPKLAEALTLARRIAPPDFPIKSFVQAGMRIIELEEKTGTPFEDLHAQYEQEDAEIKQLRKRRESIEQDIKTANERLQETLTKNNATLQILQEYGRDRHAFQSAGFSVADLKRAADFIRKATAEGALDAAVELSGLELQTGKHHSTLMREYKDAMGLTNKLRLEAREISEEIKRSKLEITRLQREEEQQLASNRVTRAQLTKYSAIREELESMGINWEKLEKLNGVLCEIENHGWKAGSIIKYIEEIGNLERERNRARADFFNAERRVGEENGILGGLLRQIGTANTELVRLRDAERQCKNDLARLREQSSKERFRIELSDALFSLLMNPSTATGSQLTDLIAALQAVDRARNETVGLPIDYGQLRERAILVVENVLGKKLVLRETMENGLRLLRDKNTELLFDRLGNIARERIELDRTKTELDLEKKNLMSERTEFEESSNEKLLSTVVGQFGKGLIYSKTCEDCRTTFAFQLGKGALRKDLSFCPFCLVGSLRERRKLQTHKVTEPV
jgi:DNA repair exonuclease SbcCD ATPase subunit